jgi:lipid-A-disaccharide synthase
MSILRVAMVAAEPSGDMLGGQLIAALSAQHSQLQIEGIGGSQMIAAGLQTLAPLEALSVMGLVEVLGHLPSLLRLRHGLIQRWLQNPPDIFIGIDAPDFNLPLAKRLRTAGIPTVHYVCPSIWAWRPGRVKKIQAAVDLLLSVFPFEQDYLREHGVDACYVGHTLATQIPLQPDQQAARKTLSLDTTAPVLAVLPGSRRGEVSRLAQPFLATARACREQIPGLQMVAPMVSTTMAEVWQTACATYAPELPVQIVMQDSQSALSAADVALVASGTATLEGLLCKCPMVVGYQVHPLSAGLLKMLRLVNTDRVVLANLLADEPLAPAFLQQACVSENLVPAVLHFLQKPQLRKAIQQRYTEVHQMMQVDTSQRIATAIFKLLQTRNQ